MQDMTRGDIRKHILVFTWPLLISNILQVINLGVNRVWAGKFLGNDAIAAITISMVVLYIMISLAIGLTIGTSTVIAQYFGAKKIDKVRLAVGNSIFIIGLIAIIMTVVVNLTSSWILHLMQTPPGVYHLAMIYLQIASISFVFLFVQILIGFIFRAIGDSITPLIFSGIGVLLNMIFDPFLMLGIYPFPRMGVTGAAISFVLSAIICALISFYYLKFKGKILEFKFIYIFKLDKEIIMNILKLGIPTGLENVVVSTAIAIVQMFIDKYGASAAAAMGAVAVVINIILFVVWSFGAGVSVFCGQNMGAGNLKRVSRGLKEGLKITIVIGACISIVSFVFSKYVLLIFLNSHSTVALAIGDQSLKILAFPWLFLVIIVVLDSFFTGVGANTMALILTTVGMWGFRIPLMILFGHFYGLTGIWIGLAASYILTALISFLYYKTGWWKTKSIIKH